MESKSFIRLNEMREEMLQSGANIIKIINQQNKLIKMVQESKDKDFDEFIKSLKDANKNYSEQLQKLDKKREMLDKLIDELTNNSEKKELADKIFDVLGIN